jgi:hypothetical protein
MKSNDEKEVKQESAGHKTVQLPDDIEPSYVMIRHSVIIILLEQRDWDTKEELIEWADDIADWILCKTEITGLRYDDMVMKEIGKLGEVLDNEKEGVSDGETTLEDTD